MSVVRHLFAVLLSLGAVGCASALPSDRPAPSVLTASSQIGSPDVQGAALDRWWVLFSDPALDALVDRALANSPTAAAIAARIEQARALRSEAKASEGWRGDLGFAAQTRRTERTSGAAQLLPERTEGSASVSFAPSWEVDFWGRRKARIATADAEVSARLFSAEASRALLAAEVVSAVMQIRELQAREDEVEAQARVQAELLRLVARRGETGLAARSDADSIASGLERSRAESAGLWSEKAAAIRSLGALLGVGREPLDLNGPLPSTVPSPPTLVDAGLLARRPDVQEARANLAAAAGRARIARLALMPSLSFSPSAGLNAIFEPGEANGSFWILGLRAELPILDRPRLMAALGGETARRAEAVAELEQAVQTALSEADRAFLLLDGARTRLDRLKSSEEAAERAFSAARRRYDAGLNSFDPVLDAERVWREARTASLEARVRQIDLTISAFKALGGGWSPRADVSKSDAL